MEFELTLGLACIIFHDYARAGGELNSSHLFDPDCRLFYISQAVVAFTNTDFSMSHKTFYVLSGIYKDYDWSLPL